MLAVKGGDYDIDDAVRKYCYYCGYIVNGQARYLKQVMADGYFFFITALLVIFFYKSILKQMI